MILFRTHLDVLSKDLRIKFTYKKLLLIKSKTGQLQQSKNTGIKGACCYHRVDPSGLLLSTLIFNHALHIFSILKKCDGCLYMELSHNNVANVY